MPHLASITDTQYHLLGFTIVNLDGQGKPLTTAYEVTSSREKHLRVENRDSS
jgi:hypothetical protein